jgi:hypothetical protein
MRLTGNGEHGVVLVQDHGAHDRGRQSDGTQSEERTDTQLAQLRHVHLPDGHERHEQDDDVGRDVARREGLVKQRDVEAVARNGRIPKLLDGNALDAASDAKGDDLADDDENHEPGHATHYAAGKDTEVQGQDRKTSETVGRRHDLLESKNRLSNGVLLVDIQDRPVGRSIP